MGSSTRVRKGTATASPSRPANSDRPLITADAERPEDSRPTNDDDTDGSSSTVSRRDAGLRAPSRRVAFSLASFTALAMSRSSGVRATE